MTNQAKQAKWDAIISDLEASGLNPNQYATRHEINKTSLYYHLRKRRETTRDTTKQRAEPRGLVHEVKLSELKVYAKPDTLRLSHGDAYLTFGELPDPAWLAELIRDLER